MFEPEPDGTDLNEHVGARRGDRFCREGRCCDPRRVLRRRVTGRCWGAEALAAPRPMAGGRGGRQPAARDAGYWEFADWLQPAMDRLWSDSLHVYTNDTRINSCRADDPRDRGVRGPRRGARSDERARQLAARLCESPPLRVPRDGRPTRHSDPRSETPAPRARAGWRAWPTATARCTSRSTRRWRAPSITPGARASSSACPRTLVARMVQACAPSRSRRSSAIRTCA